MRIAQIPRREWLNCYLDYQPGQHWAWFEATQQGKTHHMYQSAEIALAQNPGLTAVSLMPKSRSPATRMWAERLGWKVLDNWPPPPRWPGQGKPNGYVLWPKHLKDVQPKVNREHLAAIFRKCLAEQYRRGESLTIADDAHILAALLELNPEFEEILTAGSEGGAGMWLSAQKTSGSRATGSLTTFAYNQPDQFLLGYEPIEANRQRFNEIGGVDAGMVSDIVSRLPRYPIQTPGGVKYISDKLHLDLRGPWMCQVTGL
jgi:hypothetical protein